MLCTSKIKNKYTLSENEVNNNIIIEYTNNNIKIKNNEI